MPFNTIYPIGRNQIYTNLKKGEICQTKVKIGKWKMNFLIFSKTINMTHGAKTIFFHHIWASTKAAPDIGGIMILTMQTWNYFSKMNRIFWAFLPLLWHKGERRYGEEEGMLKSQKGPRSIISLNHENFLSLIKVIKQK